MKGSRVAIRYAKALLATAQEQQAVDQVADDMESVLQHCLQYKSTPNSSG